MIADEHNKKKNKKTKKVKVMLLIDGAIFHISALSKLQKGDK